MTALALSETAQVHYVAHGIYILAGPGAATVFRHICAIILATAILDLLQCVQAQSFRHRQLIIGIVFLGALVVLWAVEESPAISTDPSIYPPLTWPALLHWLLYLGYLSFALMAAMWACQNQSLHIGKSALNISLRIISWGLGLGLIFTISNTFSVLFQFFLGSTPEALSSLTGLQSLAPSLFFVVLGLSWPRLYSIGQTQHIRRQIAQLYPEWQRVMRGSEGNSLVRLVPENPTNFEELHWKLSRLVTEIYDSYLIYNCYVDSQTLIKIRRRLAQRSLTVEERNIILQSLCCTIGRLRKNQGFSVGPLLYIPQISALTLRDAAGQLLRATRVAQRRRVRRTILELATEFTPPAESCSPAPPLRRPTPTGANRIS